MIRPINPQMRYIIWSWSVLSTPSFWNLSYHKISLQFKLILWFIFKFSDPYLFNFLSFTTKKKNENVRELYMLYSASTEVSMIKITNNFWIVLSSKVLQILFIKFRFLNYPTLFKCVKILLVFKYNKRVNYTTHVYNNPIMSHWTLWSKNKIKFHKNCFCFDLGSLLKCKG